MTGIVRAIATAALACSVASAPVSAAARPSALAVIAASLEPLVEIEVDDELEDADFIRDGLREESERQLDIQGVPHEIDPEHPRKIRIEVSGAPFEYEVRTEVTRRGAPLHEPLTTTCACNKGDLVKEALKSIVAALDALERADAAELEPDPVSEHPADPEAEGATRSSDERRVGALGGVGIGLLVIGLGGVAGGAVMVVQGETVDLAANNAREEGRDFRPPGYALIGVGGALVIAGIAMLATDQVKRRRSRRAAFVPTFDGRAAGLTLHARF